MTAGIHCRRHVGQAFELMAHVTLIRVTRRKGNVRQRSSCPLNKLDSMVKPLDRGEGFGGNPYRFEKHALKLAAALAECDGSLIDSDRAVGCRNQGNNIINSGWIGLPPDQMVFKNRVEPGENIRVKNFLQNASEGEQQQTFRRLAEIGEFIRRRVDEVAALSGLEANAEIMALLRERNLGSGSRRAIHPALRNLAILVDDEINSPIGQYRMSSIEVVEAQPVMADKIPQRR